MQSTFFEKVYEIVKKISAGKVSTYKDIARLAGSPNASRAVGCAMKNNPDKSIIPCHRILGADGSMHGYAFGGVLVKINMLKGEGVFFRGDFVDLSKSRWEGI